jgi:hemoglobin-like flavoprotein
MLQSSVGTLHIDSVLERVSESWIPAQGKVIDEIISKMYCGFYEESPELLLSDLKRDVSTYLYTTRAFAENGYSIRNHKTTYPVLIPLLNEIKRKFACEDISQHARAPFQMEVLHEAIMSTAVVSELSKECNIEAHTSYSVAMLRHLGRALLAWNYPKEFSHALEILNEKSIESPLDRILSNIFGFSPSSLGGKIILEMGHGKNLVRCIHYNQTKKTPAYRQLLHICEIGEKFAMAHSTIQHPIKSKEISEVLSHITNKVGDKGIRRIYQSTSNLFQSYSKSYPEIYHSFNKIDQKNFTKHLHGKICLTRLARAATIPNKQATALIEMVLEGSHPEKLIKKLFHEILPSLGITSSIVFTVSPLEETLIPIFKKGAPSFIKVEDISIYAFQYKDNLIRDVFTLKKGHTARGISHDQKEKIFTTIPFPAKPPIGVLYLEAGNDLFSKKQIENLSLFVSGILEYFHGVSHS